MSTDTVMTLHDMVFDNPLMPDGGDVVYANVITGLDIVWDGHRTFHVYRNVGTVNDGEYVFIDTFIHVVRNTIEACDAAIAFANSRKGQAMHRPVRGYVA